VLEKATLESKEIATKKQKWKVFSWMKTQIFVFLPVCVSCFQKSKVVRK
jgi:hypothetical protein